MKKLNLALTVFLFLFLQATIGYAYNGYDVKLLKSDGLDIELEFTLSDYDFEKMDSDDDDDDENFTIIKFNNSVRTTQKGFAELPKLFSALALPGQGNVRAEIISSSYNDIKLTTPLLPSKGVVLRNENIDDIPYEIDPSSIIDAWYPENVIHTNEPYIFRDVRGVNVYVHPFQYNAVSQTVRVHEKIVVRLSEERSETINPLPIYRTRRAAAREMNSIYSDLFLNYRADAKRAALQIGDMGDLLVIHTSRDANAIKPYVQWKQEKGFKVTTEQVSSGTNVKAIIKNAYGANKNLLYVQLVGDWQDIKSDVGGGASAPMDPVLGCVVGTDNFPDIIIGRFSAGSASDVTTQVNKAITYEKSPSGSWYKSGLGIASHEGAGQGDDNEADFEHMDIIKQNKLLKSSYTNVHEIYKSGSASTVSSYVNQGLSVINYVGHGSETSFATTGFSNSDIAGLSNGAKLPFVISVACVNGAFHRSGGDCFAEAWLKKQGGGAVATVMSTINQPWQPPMRGQDYMNDILIGGYNYNANPGNGTNVTEGRTTFGSIVFNGLVLMYAESAGSADLNTIQTWTIFGDASVQVRRDTAKTIALSNKTVASGTPFTTKVTASGSAVEGAIVSLFQNGTVASGLTNSSGSVTINHPFTSGTLTLTGSGFNLTTSSQSVTIGGGGNQPPNADFTFNVNGSTVNFTDGSTDPDGSVTAWSWNFDDGQTSTQKNPRNTYAKDGSYRVTLTVTDNKNATDTATKTVQIGNQPQQYNLVVNNQGQGSVTLDPPGGKYDPNTRVTLTANAASGWKFSAWSGDVTGSTSPATVTMDSNKNVTATFVEDSTPPPQDSCEGNCGNKAPSGCWCDSLCEQYGDCCADKKQFCGF